jgi:hypothetical protein
MSYLFMDPSHGTERCYGAQMNGMQLSTFLHVTGEEFTQDTKCSEIVVY